MSSGFNIRIFLVLSALKVRTFKTQITHISNNYMQCLNKHCASLMKLLLYTMYFHALVHTHLYLVFQIGVGVQLLKQLICRQVKGRDDLLGVAHKLRVKIFVEVGQVIAVDIQERLFKCVDLQGQKNHLKEMYRNLYTPKQYTYLFQPSDIVRLCGVTHEGVLIIITRWEVIDISLEKVTKSLFRFLNINISSPDDQVCFRCSLTGNSC